MEVLYDEMQIPSQFYVERKNMMPGALEMLFICY